MDISTQPKSGVPIRQLLSEFATGRLTPSGVVDDALALSEMCQRDVKAFAHIEHIGATAAAVESNRHYREGSARQLEGVPVGIKDLIDTAGIPTKYGSPAYSENVPIADAEVVRLLKSKGAVIVGKTATHEFAWGVTTSSSSFGDTLNPHDRSRIPGGSSGGMAAAIAYGALRAGLGTDTGGSVRIPAALCGIVGYKPSYGLLPTTGVFPLASSLDHIGILGSSVADVALVSMALDIATAPPGQLGRYRVGALGRIGGVPTSTPVASAFVDACEQISRNHDLVVRADVSLFDRSFALFAGIVLAEGGITHFRRNSAAFIHAHYGAETASRLALAEEVTVGQYASWLQARREFSSDLEEWMTDLDFLICPTCPCTAPFIGQDHIEIEQWSGSVREALMTYTAPFNLSGLPAISLPMRPSAADGMPIGLQIIAPRGRDGALLNFAAEIERFR
ncbi:amidase [Rhizobium sp. CECT 9324]|uniref:amidase n=1 Tax=Rhizobium sp. CECT 9324 TaxID=2845820 RepID=UPI001E2E1B35|nr:amidase [Rhizobium sp. CECT 9324]CAH0340849.1 Glutamyl-tRNA(Gln) amidotransferase subunit A [Rhizobium sp. CECT 9324]